MLLTIQTNYQPATDLGYLLHKHPDKHQVFDLSFGKVHVFYPESGVESCKVAMLLAVNPVTLSRNSSRNYADSFKLGHYVKAILG